MKKLLTILSVLIILAILLNSSPSLSNNDYLRIHIRANSNETVDQTIKYKVKDAVIDYMIPYLAQCENKEMAFNITKEHLSEISSVATSVLKDNGFSYTAEAKLCQEEFPTRSYENLTLESGFYDALIINLGSAAGNNWWCVVYPPLCFVNGSAEVSEFKSRILELIESFI